MDPFPVERYLGEEETNKNDGFDADDNMCKLLSKIKQRSKLKFSTSTSEQNADISPLENGRVKKKQKIKHAPEDLINTNERQSHNLNANEVSHQLEDQLNKLNIEPEERHNIVNDEYRIENENEIKSETFTVLGDYKFKKKSKVKRVLPDWLLNPSVVSVDLKNLEVSISDFPDLHSNFITTLRNNGISHFFPVQAQVIPYLLGQGKRAPFLWPSDVCVSAPTGSGKTLAYVLPILQALMGRRVGQIQALVVLPVQDLAAQVASVFRAYNTGTGLRVHLSTGGLPLQEDRAQLLKHRMGGNWESLVDILVITPGRLVEHLYSSPGFLLKHLQYIVIDEADRIVDNMQNNWLHHLDQHLSVQGCPLLTIKNLKTLPRRPQKLLFSATLSIDPEKLNQLHLFQPRLFTSVVEATKDQGGEGEFIGKFTTPAELEEKFVRCMLAVKPLVLYHLITAHSWSRVLVFTSSSRSVHQLSALLILLSKRTDCQLSVAEISAECSSRKRETVLADFASGKVNVLVSTDALARGMDIAKVRYVVSYDMPKFPKAYIHRVGRTGRAGHHGTAVTMVTHSQIGKFQDLLQTAGKKDSVTEMSVDEEQLKELEEPFKDALQQLKKVTEGEEMKKLHQTKSLKRAVTTSKVISSKRKKKRYLENNNKKLKTE